MADFWSLKECLLCIKKRKRINNVSKPFSNFIFSIRYPDENITRHLSQIYEAIFEGLIPSIILLILFLKKKLSYGVLTSIFLINYAIARFIIEFIRQPDLQIGLKYNYFTQGQLLTIPILILGLIIFYKCQLKRK